MAGLCIVLDRIEDRGNRAAVLRSAEALGILNVHEVAPTDPERGRARGVGGAGEKWLNIHVHANAASCRAALPDAMLLAALPPVPEVAAAFASAVAPKNVRVPTLAPYSLPHVDASWLIAPASFQSGCDCA